MSIETKELIESRRFVRGCEKDQGQRRFLIWDTDGSVELDVLDALKHLETNREGRDRRFLAWRCLLPR